MKGKITEHVKERDAMVIDECQGDISEFILFDIIDSLAQESEPVQSGAIERLLEDYEEEVRTSYDRAMPDSNAKIYECARAELASMTARLEEADAIIKQSVYDSSVDSFRKAKEYLRKIEAGK